MVNIDRKVIPGLPVLNNFPIENSSPVLTGYNLRLLVCPTIPVFSFDEDQIHKLAVSQTLGLLVFISSPTLYSNTHKCKMSDFGETLRNRNQLADISTTLCVQSVMTACWMTMFSIFLRGWLGRGWSINGGMKRVVYYMCHYCGWSVSGGRAHKIRKIKITGGKLDLRIAMW